MKRIKYISATVLIILGLLWIGEVNVQKTIHAISNEYVSVWFDFGDMNAAASDICSIAASNNVIAFTHDRVYASGLEQTYLIYSTDELPKSVADSFGVGKNLNSIFLGDTNIKCENICNIPKTVNSPLYFYGEESAVKASIIEISELFPSISSINEATIGTVNDITTLVLWLIIVAYILFLTLADVAFLKKEVFIRVSFGGSLTSIIGNSIVRDICFFSVIFAAGCFVIQRFTSVLHNPSLILGILGILVVSNSLIYLTLLRIDTKLAISSSKTTNNVLKYCYIIKGSAALFAIVSISMGILLFQTTEKYFKADSFFSAHKEYYFCYFQHRYDISMIDDAEELLKQRQEEESMLKSIYLEYYDTAKPIILINTYNSADYDHVSPNDFNIITANIHAIDYISTAIDGFTTDNITQDICFLIPGSMSDSQKDNVFKYLDMERYLSKPHTIYYYDTHSRGTEVLAINRGNIMTNGFLFINDPVIILDFTLSEDIGHISHLNGAIMYSFTDQQLADIIKQYGLENEITEITNVYDYYSHYWMLVRVGVYTTMLTSVLSLMLAIVTTIRIINLEYVVNSVELCVKRILGYSVFAKNRGVLIPVLLSDVLCMVGVVLFAINTGTFLNTLPAIAIATGIILLIDIASVTYYMFRIENARIVNILKGGAL